MRDQMCFYARIAMSAASVAATLFVFGAGPVRAQTAPAATPAPAGGVKLPAAAQGPVRRLTADEAVLMALEQNINLQVDRIDPQVSDLAISVARSTWTPAFFSNVRTQSQTNPPTDIFGGASTVTNENVTSQAGIQQLLPWGGASYSAFWNSGRFTTNNIFSSFNPQLNSTMGDAQLQDRWHTPAGHDLEEESRDLRRAAAAIDRGDHTQCEECVLGSGLRDQQPGCAATIAATRAATSASSLQTCRRSNPSPLIPTPPCATRSPIGPTWPRRANSSKTMTSRFAISAISRCQTSTPW
jgi:hypothetical protein